MFHLTGSSHPQVTLECLHEMFQSAKHTMHWLRCAWGCPLAARSYNRPAGSSKLLRRCTACTAAAEAKPRTPFRSSGISCSECARLIAKEGHCVMWHTPLGLPVVQPYRRKDRQHVRTLLQVQWLLGEAALVVGMAGDKILPLLHPLSYLLLLHLAVPVAPSTHLSQCLVLVGNGGVLLPP